MTKSVHAKPNRQKPRKPSPSFPLTPHNNGQWCKKIRGKVHFFGIWEDPQGALDNYLRVAADLHAGREPRTTTLSQGAVTVKDVRNHRLTAPSKGSGPVNGHPRWLNAIVRSPRAQRKRRSGHHRPLDRVPRDLRCLGGLRPGTLTSATGRVPMNWRANPLQGEPCRPGWALDG